MIQFFTDLSTAAAIAIAAALPFAAQAQTATSTPDAADALQAIQLCEMPAPDEIQILATARDAEKFSQLFAQLQTRWPDVAVCLDAPTEVSQSQLWIRVATVGEGDRAQAIAREVSALSGYPAVLRAFRSEG